MDKYPRLFIQMSLIYLFFGVVVALLKIFGIEMNDMKFMHAHYNLLGFMTMMVAGVSYFVVPRFNGTTLYYPQWVPIHFWLHNIGLLILISGFHLKQMTRDYPYSQEILVIGGVLTGLGLMMYVINLFLTIQKRNRHQENPYLANESEAIETPRFVPAKTEAQPIVQAKNKIKWIRIQPTDKVADIVDNYPGTLDILVEMGLTPLAFPGHIDRVRQIGIPLGSACMNHGIDIEMMIGQLEEFINAHYSANSGSGNKAIDQSMIIGDVLSRYPTTKEIFMKYYGAGCFSCPGQSTETIEQSARMHNVDINLIIEELNKVR